MMDDQLFEIGRLVLGPGDVLVVRTKVVVSAETRERIKLHFKDVVPANNPVIVVGPDIELGVLTREDVERGEVDA